jgi:hypothetical protein
MNLYSILTASVLSVAPLMGWTRISYEITGTSCTVVYFENDGYESYILLSVVLCYVIPGIVLAMCKRRYCYLKKHSDAPIMPLSVSIFFKNIDTYNTVFIR